MKRKENERKNNRTSTNSLASLTMVIQKQDLIKCQEGARKKEGRTAGKEKKRKKGERKTEGEKERERKYLKHKNKK